MREFTDQDGCNWVVYAITDGAIEGAGRRYLPDEYQRGWLVFECEHGKKRLAPPPDGWDSCPECDLVEHWRRARDVGSGGG